MSTLADILNSHFDEFQKTRILPFYVQKTIKDIRECRTEAMGYRIDVCEHCGYENMNYNSCGNRHCNKCQGKSAKEWIEKRKKDLLPAPYFHVVLTIPDSLNEFVLKDAKLIYNILFKAGSETILEIGRDPKHLGGDIGLIAVLHTWGQNLSLHPHLHCIVPGGGLSFDGNRWLCAKGDFLVHVKVISKLFRGKFLAYLKQSYYRNELKFDGSPYDFESLMTSLYHKGWVTYIKPPFAGPESVIEYLGRYTHKVAISNSRIIRSENGKVTFRWRDYRDNNKQKIMELDNKEFIRRFILHILPTGFVKIRHYGILSNQNKRKKLSKLRELLKDCLIVVKVKKEEKELGEVRPCPCCGEYRVFTQELRPATRDGPYKGGSIAV